jgi:O-antigen/teichoic acid export membrane protein
MAMADKGLGAVATPEGSPYQKFAKDVIIVGITTVLVAFSAILTLPLITRTIGAENYGIWTQSLVTMSLVGGVAGLGLPAALTRFLPAKTSRSDIRDDFYSVVCVTFTVILLASAVIAGSAPFIARVFFDGATNVVRLTALLILIFSCTAVYMSLLRALRSMKAYALFMLLDAYGQVGLMAYMLLHGYGLLSLFCGIAIMKSVVLICLVAYAGQRIGFGRPLFANMRGYLHFGVPIIATSVSWWVVSSSDRYVIAGFLGSESVGVYSAAYNLGNVPYMVIGVIGLVLPPTLSKLYDEGRTRELAVTMSYSLKYFLLLAIPFVVGAAVLAEQVLKLFTGSASLASQGHQVVPLIAASILIYGTYAVISNSLALARKTSIIGLVWIGAAAVNLLLNLILVPSVGIVGSAIGSLIAYSLALVVTSHRSFKEVRFPIDWRFIMKSLAASGVMTALVWFLDPITSAGTVIAVLAGTAVYAVVLVLLRGIRRDEINFFKGIVVRQKATGGISQQ